MHSLHWRSREKSLCTNFPVRTADVPVAGDDWSDTSSREEEGSDEEDRDGEDGDEERRDGEDREEGRQGAEGERGGDPTGTTTTTDAPSREEGEEEGRGPSSTTTTDDRAPNGKRRSLNYQGFYSIAVGLCMQSYIKLELTRDHLHSFVCSISFVRFRSFVFVRSISYVRFRSFVFVRSISYVRFRSLARATMCYCRIFRAVFSIYGCIVCGNR